MRRSREDIVCEVLSTCPYPLACMLRRHGLGRVSRSLGEDADSVELGVGGRFRQLAHGGAKAPPRRVLHVDLEPGSLLIMDYATQLHYTHGVPKTTEPVGERISLAFRVKPMRGAPSDNRGSDLYR